MKQAPNKAAAVPDEGEIWALLLELGRLAKQGNPVSNPRGLRLDRLGRLEMVPADLGWLPVGSESEQALDAPARRSNGMHELIRLLELYVPLCVGARCQRFVVGHLGQSLDGQIAVSSGASRNVTGPENIRHMHRLRALCDAVVVGASTVTFDDPQLTTRLVSGQSPVRVVIDPSLRVPRDRRVFTDGRVKTLLLADTAARFGGSLPAHVELLRIPSSEGVLSVPAILSELRRRGLGRLFVEGGGVTVSHFLAARAFTRLHITVSPVFLGEGRPGIKLPAIACMDEALRPAVRRFDSGQDVLFDFSFESEAQPESPASFEA